MGGTPNGCGGPVAVLEATCVPKGSHEPFLSILIDFGTPVGHQGAFLETPLGDQGGVRDPLG